MEYLFYFFGLTGVVTIIGLTADSMANTALWQHLTTLAGY